MGMSKRGNGKNESKTKKKQHKRRPPPESSSSTPTTNTTTTTSDSLSVHWHWLHALILTIGIFVGRYLTRSHHNYSHDDDTTSTRTSDYIIDSRRLDDPATTTNKSPNNNAPSDTAIKTKISSDNEFQQAIEAWNGTLIDHIPYENLTYRQFVSEYQIKRKPVVIRGMHADSPLTEGVDEANWGWKAMRRRFGNVVLDNRIEGTSGQRKGGEEEGGAVDRTMVGCTGLGLCTGNPITLASLFDEYFLQRPSSALHETADHTTTKIENNVHHPPTRHPKPNNHPPIPYPHDIELRRYLPEMFSAYRKSNYFIENLHLPINGGTSKWPSLFFGARGTSTKLHVDGHGTSFAMSVFRGRKQFLLLDAREGEKLCMTTPTDGLDYGVGYDPFVPELEEACPEARGANAYFADVRGGDLLFVPGHMHHAARNLIQSLGVSDNFLTMHDFNAINEDFGGYSSKINNAKTLPPGEKTPVNLQYLVTRDLYRLLNETNYASNWHLEREFWNADEATAESYRRLLSHLSTVLHRNDDGNDGDASKAYYTTRLTFLSNPEITRMSLRAHGLWDCMEPHYQHRFETQGDNTWVGTDMIQLMEEALQRSIQCRGKIIAEEYIVGIKTNLRDALRTLHLEEGLTKYCCT
eukprot:CAMPEP_0183728352 /NCGR_PEP_ID=MMETSP0737-20130205/27790_1 /TAXON_ID=385413 /ORGANISM="Thalassiosira miniscula, Strain CCMP1093" /LENGTH=635 /DNA_ID=CAMNT_0025960263 /DNA_START=22 /DNA_END=1929 /DNA_ORIENTATION=-